MTYRTDTDGRNLPDDERAPRGASSRTMTDLGGGVYRDRHGVVYRVTERRVYVYHGQVGPHSSGSISRAIWESRLRSGGASAPDLAYAELVPTCAPVSGLEVTPAAARLTSLDTVQKILGEAASGTGWRARQDRADWLRRQRIAGALAALAVEHDREGDDIGALRCRAALERMTGCGVLRGVAACAAPGCGHQGQPERYACGQWHMCPYCARIHSRARQAELLRVVRRYRHRQGCRWRLWTLTVRTEGDLMGATRRLAGAIGALWSEYLRWAWVPLPKGAAVTQRRGRTYHGHWRVEAARDGTQWIRVGLRQAGGFRSIEFGERTGNAHLHLLASSPWVPQSLVAAAWERMTGSFVVYVQIVGGTQRQGGQIDVRGAVSEVCKYVAKIGTIRPALAVAGWEALRGHSTTQVYGALRGLVLDEAQVGWTCPVCGGHLRTWLGVAYDVARAEHERGPPDYGMVAGVA